MLLSIEKLNTSPQGEFEASVNHLFETAPPLSAGLYGKRPFDSYEHLIDTAREVSAGLSADDKIEVINSHPAIGLKPTEQMSALSFAEQGLDKEASLDPNMVTQTYERLQELNQEYEKKFGFRFVVFVAGRPKHALLPVFEERLQNPREQEVQTALEAMFLIARDRLKKAKL
eukprot:TRINITY_DN14840_c0_g1_i1.p1 TRINITY_DN14840_c0_g1~~TRINITY_DN14840_c0_g1_i1.p1  ORF type:complete len:172 (-),score=36.87 TRINITY_DN14840_c0_g1_i1:13-528(-)